MKPVVVNKYKESFDIYIGRGSKWGNPFVIGKDGSREEVIQKFKTLLYQRMLRNEVTMKDFSELSGKKLGCFCKPQACHGDVIVAAYECIMKDE